MVVKKLLKIGNSFYICIPKSMIETLKCNIFDYWMIRQKKGWIELTPFNSLKTYIKIKEGEK